MSKISKMHRAGKMTSSLAQSVSLLSLKDDQFHIEMPSLAFRCLKQGNMDPNDKFLYLVQETAVRIAEVFKSIPPRICKCKFHLAFLCPK